MIKISGIIGLSILYNKKFDKKIFIFYDDHSNNKYCVDKSNTNLFISDLLDNIQNEDIGMILEEPFIETDSKIKILWEDSNHLILFRKFYKKLMNKCSNKKICKLFPIDIRLSIFEISPDEIILNLSNHKNEYNIPVNKYFENIHYLFDIKNKYIKSNSVCVFIKKVLNIYKTSEFYIYLKDKILNFTKKYKLDISEDTIYNLIKENNKSSNFIYEQGFPFYSNMNNNFIDEMDKITSSIMELYTIILLLLLPNKNIIFYGGYYHSNNITYILQKKYNFNLEYNIGNTENIEKKNLKEIISCIKIEKKHLNFLQ